MPSYEDDLPTLFRSLKPDPSALLNDTAINAKEAGQKWPLLRNISAQNRDLPPALSSEERLSWTVSESAANNSATKPALSRHGLGEKIASGLGKMSARTASVASQPALRDEAPARESSTPMKAAHSPAETTPQVPPSKQNESTQRPSITSVSAVATESASHQPSIAPFRTAGPAPAQESLAQVFHRLEGKAKPAPPRPTKSPSFLGRLGRR